MNMFGSWSRMLTIMENSLPEVWAEIKQKQNPKPVPPKVPKPASLTPSLRIFPQTASVKLLTKRSARALDTSKSCCVSPTIKQNVKDFVFYLPEINKKLDYLNKKINFFKF